MPRPPHSLRSLHPLRSPHSIRSPHSLRSKSGRKSLGGKKSRKSLGRRSLGGGASPYKPQRRYTKEEIVAMNQNIITMSAQNKINNKSKGFSRVVNPCARRLRPTRVRPLSDTSVPALGSPNAGPSSLLSEPLAPGPRYTGPAAVQCPPPPGP